MQLMGIETSADHGGSECNFTSAIIVIEELAKVDPSVSVMCDVHNTLVNTIFRKYGTQEQKDKWLPQLAESKVRHFLGNSPLRFVMANVPSIVPRLARSACRNPPPGPTRSRCKRARRRTATTG